MPDVGTLQVSLVSNRGKRPITDAAVEISSAGEPDKILEVLKTDLSGQTEVIELETPPLEYSMEPGLNQPYSEYNLKITASGNCRKSDAFRAACFAESLFGTDNYRNGFV